MMESSTTTVLSAPGKVLLAGGYLVLDPHYSGVVVSTSSRFYTVVSSSLASSSSDSNGTTIKTNITTQDSRSRGRARNDPIRIRVRSPQFVDATWLYVVSIQETTIRIEQIPDEFVFPFLPFHSPTLVSLTSFLFSFYFLHHIYLYIYVCLDLDLRHCPRTNSFNLPSKELYHSLWKSRDGKVCRIRLQTSRSPSSVTTIFTPNAHR